MRPAADRFQLSASDLANHLGCHHLTQLDLAVAKGNLAPPKWRDPALEVLQGRGWRSSRPISIISGVRVAGSRNWALMRMGQRSSVRTRRCEAVLKLMFGATTRAAERWPSIRITEFERRQMAALRHGVRSRYEAEAGLQMTRSELVATTKFPSKSRT